MDDAGAPLLIDTHASSVADAVWTLYAHLIARTGPIPTLIEWDSNRSRLADAARASNRGAEYSC